MNKVNYNVINKIIEIGRLETISSTFNPNNIWWRSVLYFNRGGGCDDLSYEDLKCLYKGVVLCEKDSERYMGSTTNTSWILNMLIMRLEQNDNLEEIKELYDFGFTNRGKNGYVPTGTIIHSHCENHEDYSSTNRYKARVAIEHEERQLRQQAVRKERLENKKIRMEERAEQKKERDKKVTFFEKRE